MDYLKSVGFREVLLYILMHKIYINKIKIVNIILLKDW